MQFLILPGCDFTQLPCGMGQQTESFLWGGGEEGREEVTGTRKREVHQGQELKIRAGVKVEML